MEREFDKKLLISNIYFLVKEKGLKLGEVEKDAGVTPGYVSRLNKEERNAKPSIEFLMGVSSILGVSMDALLTYNFEALTPTEAYVLRFVEKLISDTQADKLDWNKESEEYLSSVDYDGQTGEPDHILFKEARVYNNDYTEYCDIVEYDSKFYDVKGIKIAGDGFNVELMGGGYVYLMKIQTPDAAELPFGDTEYELYFVKGWNVTPLAHSKYAENTPFNEPLHRLYTTVSESCNHVKLKGDAKSIIDAYMQGRSLDDPELPFA